jgi:hypothetical protein
VDREGGPADIQWARALAAVVLGLVLACAAVRKVACVPTLWSVAPEFRALAGVPSLVIHVVTGDI